MKKIPDHLDNPIDNFLIKIADQLSPFFKETKHTPNLITTYSLITGLLSCYFINNKNLLLFSIFYMISYFFDCFDGHFARKYDMVTDFGDMYDHIKDMVIFFLIFIITLKNSRKNINLSIILIIFLFLFLAVFHLSCQENNCDDKFKNKSNGFLYTFHNLCSNKNNIKWSRYFGTGTFTLVYIIIICYINK